MKRDINQFLLGIMLFCLVAFQDSPMLAYAQGPDQGEEPVVIAPSGRLDLTFQQLGYGTMELNRGRSERYYRVDIPGNFQFWPADNYLDLVTYHIPDVPNKPSALTVKVNEGVLYTSYLTASNALSNTARISLTEGLLRTGTNWIKISLDTSATCEDEGSIVDVLVDQASTLSFGYQQNPYPADLSRYPYPFVEKSLLSAPVAIILPDRPTSDELAAAATVAGGLGRMSQGAIDLTAVLVSELGPDIRINHHLIVIGKPGSNALLDELALPLSIDSTTLEPGQGVLEEMICPWNAFRSLLVVSGLDDEGLTKASLALNREAHFLGMRGPFAIVTQLRPVPVSFASRPPGMTLASLGYEDQVVYGALPQDFSYYFGLPLGWRLESPPALVLKFSHADILDPYESAVDVTLNGVPLGSALLDETNAVDGELKVSLPSRLLKAGSNRLNVGIEMNLPNSDNLMKCALLDDQRAWTVISSESEIFLPYYALDVRPDLGLFPYPFGQSFGFNQTLFILPDQLSSQIASELVQLAIFLGSPSQTDYIAARVSYASEADEAARNNCHLILLGRHTQNTLLQAANAYLPQPFVADSDALEPLAVDSVAFSPDPGRDAGLLELAASPWSKTHSLLAVTGTTDEGTRLAVQTLLHPPSPLSGNLAVVEPILDPTSGEPVQVTTYAVETRPVVAISGTTGASDTASESENDAIFLAERWWK